ncbi:hypothetical protein KSP40_PGU008327 [Platanthera guangdongensis]|uniref:Uncharacterized protein n=1 Tax=Platanthera guangdongensis TaxID=2320717 RepID=A0ABR2LE52_9ASPA
MGGLSLAATFCYALWITGNEVVDLDSRWVTRSTVPRCEVQVVMITPRYALAPLTGTPGPANARENPGVEAEGLSFCLALRPSRSSKISSPVLA